MGEEPVGDSNLDPHLNRFISIIDEIPQGISAAAANEVSNIVNTKEINDNLQNLITKTCKEVFKKFWEQNDVTQKIIRLKELQENCPDEPAWRPVTGTVDINPIIMEHLHTKQEKLQNYLHSLEEESAKLKSYIKQFHQETEHQLAKVQSIEDQF